MTSYLPSVTVLWHLFSVAWQFTKKKNHRYAQVLYILRLILETQNHSSRGKEQ